MPIQVTTHRVYPSEINRIFTKPGGPIGKAIRSVCLDIASEARKLTEQETGKHPGDRPRTGRMARSWYVKVEEPGSSPYDLSFIVGNSRKYALYVDEGTKGPYPIQARRRKFLRFRGRDGRWRTVKMVMHPGIQQPYRILRRATRSTLARRLQR